MNTIFRGERRSLKESKKEKLHLKVNSLLSLAWPCQTAQLLMTATMRSYSKFDGSLNLDIEIDIDIEVAQLCRTLCDSMDCSLPGASLRGIFQARALEWVAFSFSIKSRHLMPIGKFTRLEFPILFLCILRSVWHRTNL